jgi:prephenate dehydratase
MMDNTIILGVSGEIGSFSELAGLRYAQKAKIDPLMAYLIDMEGVLKALTTHKIDIGIFPVANFLSGLVKPAFEAMGKYFFTPIDEIWLEINQSLMVKPGVKKSEINQIASHPQALAQCKRYIANEFPDIQQLPWKNTATAAKDLSKGKLPHTTAVIGNEDSARIYGLEVIANPIHDDNPNITLFIVVKSHIQEHEHGNN